MTASRSSFIGGNLLLEGRRIWCRGGGLLLHPQLERADPLDLDDGDERIADDDAVSFLGSSPEAFVDKAAQRVKVAGRNGLAEQLLGVVHAQAGVAEVLAAAE